MKHFNLSHQTEENVLSNERPLSQMKVRTNEPKNGKWKMETMTDKYLYNLYNLFIL